MKEILSPAQSLLISPKAFAEGDLYQLASPEKLLQKVQLIQSKAHECDQGSQDENAWTAVVQKMFDVAFWVVRGGLEEEEPGQFETQKFCIVSMYGRSLCSRVLTYTDDTHSQSQNIAQEYLPSDRTSFNRKADFAIAINPKHELVTSLRSTCKSYTTLSHMADSYTRNLCLVGAVEVKKLDGHAEEAKLQLGIWQAAALKHQCLTFPSIDGTPSILPSQLGWTVVGHHWHMFITWRQIDGATVRTETVILSLRSSAC